MTIRVLVVDDESLARSRLKTLLGDCRKPAAQVLGEAANAVQAIDFLQHHDVDAVLADIHMPGADGLMLAQALRQLPHPPAVVFVTAYAEHAVQAFELEALDYLTKPVRLERLQAALQKVARARPVTQEPANEVLEDVLVIQERGRAERVPLAQVLYLKAELKYLTVRTASRSYLLRGVCRKRRQCSLHRWPSFGRQRADAFYQPASTGHQLCCFADRALVRALWFWQANHVGKICRHRAHRLCISGLPENPVCAVADWLGKKLRSTRQPFDAMTRS